jgi:hypothetical protein
MAILLDRIIGLVQQEFTKKEPIWTSHSFITKKDIKYMDSECKKDSEFDPMNARKTLLHKFHTGKAPFEVKTCEYGKVIAIFDHEDQKKDIPWGLWGRILRLYTEQSASVPFTIFFLASTHLRLFPKRWFHTPNQSIGDSIQPQHINGGYTYHCNRETIMIYRAEDATRVLLHELMHSCCLDKMEKGIDQVEAETEAWAELLYVGFLSQGKSMVFHTLLQRQSDWMQTQDQAVRAHIRKPRDFPWRYTIGKEEVWKRWSILLPISKLIQDSQISLRLTAPPHPTIKKQFNVRKESTIL